MAIWRPEAPIRKIFASLDDAETYFDGAGAASAAGGAAGVAAGAEGAGAAAPEVEGGAGGGLAAAV